MTSSALQALNRLLIAQRSKLPVAPIREFLAADDIDGAYAVQQALIAARLVNGVAVTGRKIGLTAPVVQAQLGVDQPDFGVLCSDMVRAETEPIRMADLLQPKIEAEIAFTLAADITDPTVDAGKVRDAVAYATPALEIVDSRIADWDITFVDTVADNASSGLYVLGAAKVPLTAVEPREVSMTMTLDGRPVSSGTGDACLGDPLNALAWLARTAIRHGDPLRAGQVILSGALGPMVAAAAGVRVQAYLTGLGTVAATFATN
jgi:2-keto-4-pentenoate hydratase